MLAELRIELQTEEKIGVKQSSLFQGVLMELLDDKYVEYLHANQLHPYTQHIEYSGKLFWVITTTNKDAYENIIAPLLNPEFSEIYLKKRDINIGINSKVLRTKTHKELMKEFYDGEDNKYLTIDFVTPTAFKSDNQYVFMPDVRLIFGSLMNKYSSASEMLEMSDEDTLSYISKNSTIIGFDIKSFNFPVEGTYIPSFRGRVTIRMNGTSTMSSYSRLLARFGEFSGVGIKCGMGMGSIRVIDKEKKNE